MCVESPAHFTHRESFAWADCGSSVRGAQKEGRETPSTNTPALTAQESNDGDAALSRPVSSLTPVRVHTDPRRCIAQVAIDSLRLVPLAHPVAALAHLVASVHLCLSAPDVQLAPAQLGRLSKECRLW